MVMVDKRVNFSPILVPIEHTDGIVIRARENVRLRWMHCNVANVVSVLLDRLDLLCSVVIEDAEEVVIGAYHNPLLPRNEFGTAHGRVRDLYRTHLCL